MNWIKLQQLKILTLNTNRSRYSIPLSQYHQLYSLYHSRSAAPQLFLKGVPKIARSSAKLYALPNPVQRYIVPRIEQYTLYKLTNKQYYPSYYQLFYSQEPYVEKWLCTKFFMCLVGKGVDQLPVEALVKYLASRFSASF